MKELSIEEKAKAYDGIREKIAIRFGSNVADEIFSEYKESEDEKIRKELIAMVKLSCTNGNDADKKIAWLEKQGEHANFRNKIQVGDKVTRNRDGVIVNLSQLNRVAKKDEKQGEQKPAWSEEDEARFESCIKVLQTSDGYDTINAKWLKSLKERVQPQPKQEWSEEDVKMLDGIIEAAIHHCYLNITDINWLKSLKERYTWKPSDEQMRVLDLAIRCGINRGTTEETTLVSLFNDLKKLK